MAEFIVAIELGSSKITGIAGRKNLDGSISVLAVVTENSTQSVRKGVIYNLDKTVQTLSNIINKLETTLKRKIARVYVGVGGLSIRSVRNTTVKELAAETIVDQNMVNELMDKNTSMQYPELQILDATTQEYKVDNQYQIDPVGIQCSRLEGNYLNILWRKTYYRNLNKCFDNIGITIADMYLSPLVLADAVLTDAERRGGCVLVDLGAETTTVCVYYKNILRHLSVIPLGSNNVTKDLASLQMDEVEAEKLKLQHGSAYTEPAEINPTTVYNVENGKPIEQSKFVEVVEARMQEIIENAWYQVPAEYADKLLGGIILTGGGSNMRNIEQAFRIYTNADKVRTAKTIIPTINSTSALINKKDGTMCTVLSLLATGYENCAGEEITSDLFNGGGTTTTAPHKDPSTAKEPGKGRVQTEAEKAAEEKRLAEEKAAAEKAAEEQRLKEEAERLAEEQARKDNRPVNKAWRGIKNFFTKMVSEEEDDK